MMELPLFPLNTVLFPGMPLRLHIFEERYKQMMRLCLEKSKPFGVVLIAQGVEAFGPLAQPHNIGCTARIIQVEPLQEGRMNIIAVGQERFQIVALDHARPYLVGHVELIPMATDNAQEIERAGARLRPWIEKYLGILTKAGLMEFDPSQLPGDELELGYLGAALLQIPSDQKQALLASRRATGFLREMNVLYRREVALLNSMMAMDGDDEPKGAPFSLN